MTEKKKPEVKIDPKEVDFLLAAIRVKASKIRPYYSKAIFATIPIQVNGLGTFAIDKHWRFYYDPITLKEWGIELGAGVLIHEVNHVLRSHFLRAKVGGMTNANLANIAQDMEINDDLVEEGVKIPTDMLVPSMFKKENGRMFEEYYRELYDEADKIEICTDKDCKKNKDGKDGKEGKGKEDSNGSPSDSPGSGKGKGRTIHVHIKSCGSGAHGHKDEYEVDGADGDSLSPAEQEAVRRAVAEEILDYAKKSRGTVPGGLKRWADQYLKPTVPWNRELRVAMRNRLAEVAGLVDFSYSRMSRRQGIQKDLILPGFRRPVPNIVEIIDTSGSVSPKGLERAMAETAGVIKALGRSKDVMILSVDAAVHTAKKVFNPKQVELMGGGGTDMTEGFKYIKAHPKIKPDLVILITDGETPYPKEPTPYRTICLLVGDRISSHTIASVPTWMKCIVVAE